MFPILPPLQQLQALLLVLGIHEMLAALRLIPHCNKANPKRFAHQRVVSKLLL